ncbi:proteinase inhibitor I4 serpin [Streptomyces sp. ISL-43]|uniref:serpin family protein n=1 Tax=Streptomyces sp. ISL-43 TaxID=2819183 RepID=UPI001BEB0E34|nr:serpin family protein [Streptomyces sp. ISL-43]MBT2448776.1 proteinase inhibitor I4 serpin [Streptomyces sp. ISL-43]
MRISTVRAVNALTTRWAGHAAKDGAGTVFTAAGVWPLLALLADGAGGPARTELAEALGIPAEAAAEAARELLSALGGVRGLRAATGLWARRELPLEERWTDRLPAGTRGTLTGDGDTDREALDAWASDRTGGLVEKMPVHLDEDTRLVLASALALRLRWIQPFEPCFAMPEEGPWVHRPLLGLRRSTALLDRVRVAQAPTGPVTVLEVVGDGGVDVHLVLGEPQAPPGQTLRSGIATVTRAVPSTGASLLPEGNPGPGLRIGTVGSTEPRHRLDIATVAFDVRAEHDLLTPASLFGLESASDDRSGHFPGISSAYLAVASARQSALARFHAEGFEAAAVTAVVLGAAGCAMPRLRYRVRRAQVTFDRPFGFVAVHRTSRLVLAAGWVTDPAAHVEEEYTEEEKRRQEEEWYAEDEFPDPDIITG